MKNVLICFTYVFAAAIKQNKIVYETKVIASFYEVIQVILQSIWKI